MFSSVICSVRLAVAAFAGFYFSAGGIVVSGNDECTCRHRSSRGDINVSSSRNVSNVLPDP